MIPGNTSTRPQRLTTGPAQAVEGPYRPITFNLNHLNSSNQTAKMGGSNHFSPNQPGLYTPINGGETNSLPVDGEGWGGVMAQRPLLCSFGRRPARLRWSGFALTDDGSRPRARPAYFGE